jgi:hypothetical protein
VFADHAFAPPRQESLYAKSSDEAPANIVDAMVHNDGGLDL